MVKEGIGKSILTRPLPELFDELEGMVAELQEAITESKAATAEAKLAAGAAKEAGIGAATMARQAAVDALAELEKKFMAKIESVENSVDELGVLLQKYQEAVADTLTAAVDKYNEAVK